MPEEQENKNENTNSARDGLPGSPDSPKTGELFEKRYEIICLLGQGAGGQVYKARDIFLDRPVALKLIHKHLLNNAKALRRFKDEAANLTAVSHANICRIYSQGESSDGRLYMVMDYLEGRSLDKYLEDKGRLDIAEFFVLFAQLIDALAYAHQNGMVHRDIKPSNIILLKDESGNTELRPCLLDFGLAKCLDDNLDSQGSTKTASILGSSAYMSPEQCRNANDVDGRSDIYSLACVMVECLTGKPAFQGGSDFELMYKHLNQSLGQLGFLKAMPESVSKMLSKCLEKDPSKRYSSMEELKSDFQLLSEKQDLLKKKLSTEGKGRSKVMILAIIGLAALLITTIAYLQLRRLKLENQESQILDFRQKKGGKIRRDYLSHPPHSTDDLFKQVDYYNLTGDTKAGLALLKSWEKAFARAPGMEASRTYANSLLAIQYAKLFQEKEMLAYANKVLSSDFSERNADQTLQAVGQYYQNIQKPEKLLSMFAAMSAQYPRLNDFPRLRQLCQEQRAAAYFTLKDYAKAAELYQQVLKIPEAEGKYERDNWIRANLVKSLCLSNQLAKTAEIVKDILNCADSSKFGMAKAHKLVADSFARSNQNDLALEHYLKARSTFLEAAKSDFDESSIPSHRELAASAIQGEAAYKTASKRLISSELCQSCSSLDVILASKEEYQQSLDIAMKTFPYCSTPMDQAGLALIIYANAQALGKGQLADSYLRLAWQNLDRETKQNKEATKANQETRLSSLIISCLTLDPKLAEASAFIAKLEEIISSETKSASSRAVLLFYLKKQQATMLLNSGQGKKALEISEELIQDLNGSESFRARLKLSGQSPDEFLYQTYLLEAGILGKQQRFEEASKAAAMAGLSQKGMPESVQLEPILVQAECLADAKKYEEAGNLADRSFAIWNRSYAFADESNLPWISRIAVVHLKCKEYDKAKQLTSGIIKSFQKNQRKAPLSIYDLLAQGLYYQADYAETEKALAERLSTSSESERQSISWSNCELYLIEAYLNQNKFKEAELELDKLEGRCQKDLLVYYFDKRARLYEKTGERQKMIQALRRGARLTERLAIKDILNYKNRLQAAQKQSI